MEKSVKVDCERVVKLIDKKEDDFPNRKIIESFSSDGIEIAKYSMNQGDVFSFSASLDLDLEQETNKNNLLFKIEVDHPLYFAFIHLLNEENELVINDMRENDKNIKYLKITNEDDIVYLNFVDKLKKEKLDDKFSVIYENNLDFLKDRESAEENAKKNRLNKFFDEASVLLLEDCHQISFEEYAVKMKVLEKRKNAS